MAELPTYGNAVVYSEKAWAVARHASSADYDRWFPDPAAWVDRGGLTSAEMLAWTDDWVEMVPKGDPTKTPTRPQIAAARLGVRLAEKAGREPEPWMLKIAELPLTGDN